MSRYIDADELSLGIVQLLPLSGSKGRISAKMVSCVLFARLVTLVAFTDMNRTSVQTAEQI